MAAWVGARLVLQKGLPGLTSRFWAGGALLLVGLSSLPPVLEAVAPGLLGPFASDGGALGSRLAAGEQLLLSGWGALLLNVFAFLS